MITPHESTKSHTETGYRHWTRMTQAEFEALPDRNDTRDYVEWGVYRDRENPNTVFLNEGIEGVRSSLYVSSFLTRVNGQQGIDRWCAREVQIIAEDAV